MGYSRTSGFGNVRPHSRFVVCASVSLSQKAKRELSDPYKYSNSFANRRLFPTINACMRRVYFGVRAHVFVVWIALLTLIVTFHIHTHTNTHSKPQPCDNILCCGAVRTILGKQRRRRQQAAVCLNGGKR